MFCSNTPQSEGSVCRTRERERTVPSKNVGEQQNQEMPFKARTPNYCPRQQIASVWGKEAVKITEQENKKMEDPNKLMEPDQTDPLNWETSNPAGTSGNLRVPIQRDPAGWTLHCVV